MKPAQYDPTADLDRGLDVPDLDKIDCPKFIRDNWTLLIPIGGIILAILGIAYRSLFCTIVSAGLFLVCVLVFGRLSVVLFARFHLRTTCVFCTALGYGTR